MSNMYGKDKFHDRQKAVLQKSAQKIENDSGWSQDNFLREYRNLPKGPVRQHCHDRDKCGLHLEGHQRVSDGIGKRANQVGF